MDKKYDIYNKIRRDWGNISPVTKIIPNKKKNLKVKHKKKIVEEN